MPRRETEEHGTSRKPDAFCQPLLLVVGGHSVDRSSFDIRKSKWSEASGQYLFWKAEGKNIPKTEFLHLSKKNPAIYDYSFILPHYAQ
jgi:hypothetical protein